MKRIWLTGAFGRIFSVAVFAIVFFGNADFAFAMEAAGRPDEEIESDVPHVLDLVDLSVVML